MSDLIRETIVSPSSSTEAGQFLKSKLSAHHLKPVTVGSGNGTTVYGRIAAGTIMMLTPGGTDYRPCAKTLANGAVSSATTIVMDTTEGWFVGDAIFDDGVDTGETVASITNGTTLEASGAVTIADNSVLTTAATSPAVGILYHDVMTATDLDDTGSVVSADRPGQLVLVGVVDESALTGDSTQAEADMSGILYD